MASWSGCSHLPPGGAGQPATETDLGAGGAPEVASNGMPAAINAAAARRGQRVERRWANMEISGEGVRCQGLGVGHWESRSEYPTPSTRCPTPYDYLRPLPNT